jgi:adenylate cyclase
MYRLAALVMKVRRPLWLDAPLKPRSRYEEALRTAETSLRENASVPGAYRVRAASLSELGRIDEARSALTDFLRLVPDATVASTRAQVPLKGAGDLDRYVAALKRAGLRDS